MVVLVKAVDPDKVTSSLSVADTAGAAKTAAAAVAKTPNCKNLGVNPLLLI